jgi:hypothetical protein
MQFLVPDFPDFPDFLNHRGKRWGKDEGVAGEKGRKRMKAKR